MERASSTILGAYELSNVIHKVTSIVENSSSDHIFGEKRRSINPIIESIMLVMEKKAPIILERELVPGNKNSVVQVDIRDLTFDEEHLTAIFTFLKDNAFATEPPSDEQLRKWIS